MPKVNDVKVVEADEHYRPQYVVLYVALVTLTYVMAVGLLVVLVEHYLHTW